MLHDFMNSKGFTLIELLVTIAVISIISAVLLVGRGKEEERLSLGRSAFKLSQDLREVQEMVMGANSATCTPGVTYSFGVYFDQTSPDSYLVFANCNNDNKIKDSSDKILKEVKLEKKVKIKNLSFSPLNIVFVAPDPTTFINEVSWNTEGVISLGLKSDPSQQKTVKINTAGRIEIE